MRDESIKHRLIKGLPEGACKKRGSQWLGQLETCLEQREIALRPVPLLCTKTVPAYVPVPRPRRHCRACNHTRFACLALVGGSATVRAVKPGGSSPGSRALRRVSMRLMPHHRGRLPGSGCKSIAHQSHRGAATGGQPVGGIRSGLQRDWRAAARPVLRRPTQGASSGR